MVGERWRKLIITGTVKRDRTRETTNYDRLSPE